MGETYKVSYFKSKGNAEIIRLVLSAAGKEFNDERMTGEEWQKVKKDSPFAQMPLLTVTNGKTSTTYCQTGAIARHLAKKFKLAGGAENEQILIDEIFECVMDTQKALFPFFLEKDPEKKAAEKVKFVTEALPKLSNYVSKRLDKKGKNGYLVGDKLSLADLAVFNFVNQSSGLGLEDDWNKCSVIKAHQTKIAAEKNVAKWLSTRPKE